MQADPSDPASVERYRRYLTVLACTQVNPRLRHRVDVSGIIQDTLLEAVQGWQQRRGHTSAECAAWLRQILAHNLADALRALQCGKRNLMREQSLQDRLAQSSAGLGEWLAAGRSSPSHAAQREERAVRVAMAMGELPDAQRQALLLHYWHGWPLADIAAHLGRTPAAAAGLLKRGLQAMRIHLSGVEEP